jgi:hypothetical protein
VSVRRSLSRLAGMTADAAELLEAARWEVCECEWPEREMVFAVTRTG